MKDIPGFFVNVWLSVERENLSRRQNRPKQNASQVSLMLLQSAYNNPISVLCRWKSQTISQMCVGRRVWRQIECLWNSKQTKSEGLRTPKIWMISPIFIFDLVPFPFGTQIPLQKLSTFCCGKCSGVEISNSLQQSWKGLTPTLGKGIREGWKGMKEGPSVSGSLLSNCGCLFCLKFN